MNGIILKAISGFYYVDTEDGLLECKARGRFRKDGQSPLVGDRVALTPLGDGKGVLDEILPRINEFSRPAVANIQQMVIVASQVIPVTKPLLIDRVAAVAKSRDCQVLICINKCDLDSGDELYELYRGTGFDTLRVSAVTGEGIPELKAAISGKVSAFTGNSGVGKSSILNALEPDFHLKVGEVSEKLGRGRHTTRHVELFRLSCGAIIADTPGFSSFEADQMDFQLKERLLDGFPEFAPYADGCRFPDCSHTREKGCSVLQALEEGRIAQSRHESYLQLYERARQLKDWKNKE